MRKLNAILFIALVSFVFCAFNAYAQDPDDGAERITAVDLMDRLDKGENIVIFDVRAREARGETKIKGAVTMPLNELGDRIGEIPFGAMIAAYCT